MLLDNPRAIEDFKSRLPQGREAIDYPKVAFLDEPIDPAVCIEKNIADDDMSLRNRDGDGLSQIARRGVMTLAKAGRENQQRLHSQFLRWKKITMPAATQAMTPRQRR
jgi:hypothetical protein